MNGEHQRGSWGRLIHTLMLNTSLSLAPDMRTPAFPWPLNLPPTSVLPTQCTVVLPTPRASSHVCLTMASAVISDPKKPSESLSMHCAPPERVWNNQAPPWTSWALLIWNLLLQMGIMDIWGANASWEGRAFPHGIWGGSKLDAALYMNSIPICTTWFDLCDNRGFSHSSGLLARQKVPNLDALNFNLSTKDPVCPFSPVHTRLRGGPTRPSAPTS